MKCMYNEYFQADELEYYWEDVSYYCDSVGVACADPVTGQIICVLELNGKPVNLQPGDDGFDEAVQELSRYPYFSSEVERK